VSAQHALTVEVRLYDHLLKKPDADDVPEGGRWLENLNPDSLVVTAALVEPSLAAATPGTFFQFERQGYFNVDKDSKPAVLVFNRSVSLRDTWAKIEKQG
jgi:glutaminyl-tRNA synthetase